MMDLTKKHLCITLPLADERKDGPALQLSNEHTWSHRGRQEVKLRVLEGSVYLTIEGSQEDIFLGACDEMNLPARKLAVVQGQPQATFRLSATR